MTDTEHLSVAEKAELALKWARDAEIVVFDTETSGTDWKRNYPVGYVLSTDNKSVYVPVRHGGGGNLPDAGVPVYDAPTIDHPLHIGQFERELAKAISTRKGLIVGHHLKFDCHMAANAEIFLGRDVSCTQNYEALLDEYARSYSLEACCERHGVQAKKGDELYQYLSSVFGGPPTKKSMEHFWKTSGDTPLVVEYAEGDGISTGQLWRAQRELIIKDHLQQVADLEDELIWTLFRMERIGMRVDERYFEQLDGEIDLKIAEAYEALPPGFNVKSPKDVKAYLEAAGHTDWPTTDKGNPSFAEKWLKTHEEGRVIVSIRKLTTLKTTFIKPLREQHIFKGRVHATLNQLKADDSGTPARLSCSNPNLQAVPKRDKKLAPIFRMGFLADDGMVFDDDDFSQCEPRLFAHYSEDPNLLKGYNSTPFRDAHSVVAEMLSVERDPTAKRMNMGIFTGMFPRTFSEHMGWPIDQATEAWNKWHSTFPGIRQFQDTAKDVIIARGFVRTLLGRRGRLENKRFAYKAVSKIIQGGNADILKYMMLKVDKEIEATGAPFNLLMSIHDAFQSQHVPDAEGLKFRKWMKAEVVKVQQEPFNLKVPFVLDSGEGPNWGVATFGEEICASSAL